MNNEEILANLKTLEEQVNELFKMATDKSELRLLRKARSELKNARCGIDSLVRVQNILGGLIEWQRRNSK